jgi:hypothetical protein
MLPGALIFTYYNGFLRGLSFLIIFLIIVSDRSPGR